MTKSQEDARQRIDHGGDFVRYPMTRPNGHKPRPANK